jgi:hypothetical protein
VNSELQKKHPEMRDLGNTSEKVCFESNIQNQILVLEGLVIYVGLSSADGYQTMLSHVGSDHM